MLLVDLVNGGIGTVPGVAPSQVADVQTWLNTRPTYGGHVERNRRPVEPRDTAVCWSMADVVAAPHLFELGLRWTPLAAQYLGREPRLYSMNVFETFPCHQPMNPDIQEYHRDKDDSIFLALFVYLTDVLTDEDGSHLFRLGTHQGASDGEVRTMYGPAGTAFLEDGRGLHLGRRPTVKPRRMAWIRWCVSDPPPSYRWDRVRPVAASVLGDRYPSDPALQRIVHLVVA